VTQPPRRRVAMLVDRFAGVWRGLRAGTGSSPESAEPNVESRLAGLEARVEHLEAALEGLQDALYRQAVREDETREDLRRRTEPERIARELSADARRRGL
jgi:uncharacterized coiled-coil protein SlyX